MIIPRRKDALDVDDSWAGKRGLPDLHAEFLWEVVEKGEAHHRWDVAPEMWHSRYGSMCARIEA